MKLVVVVGKRGSGKTSISGTMARLLARDGHRVLAIDADSNPNLALTLGISPDRMADMPTLPRGLLRRSDQGAELNQSLEDICRSHSLAGADGERVADCAPCTLRFVASSKPCQGRLRIDPLAPVEN